MHRYHMQRLPSFPSMIARLFWNAQVSMHDKAESEELLKQEKEDSTKEKYSAMRDHYKNKYNNQK